jgi:hypothetical protein
MRPTRRLTDRTGFAVALIKLAIAVIGVGLQDAGIARQMRLRMLATAIARECPEFCVRAGLTITP